MRATIRDVAREAGVSIATVSRAMRDPGSVRPETRERVHQVASRLHYVPSHLGRQLAERRQQLVGARRARQPRRRPHREALGGPRGGATG